MQSFANLEFTDAVIRLLVGVGVIALLVGAPLGYWVASRRGSGAARIQAREEALEAERELGQAYRASVSKHFDGTSDLFRDLTRQYATLYAHLAEGARDLSEDVPELGRGYADPSLQIGGGVGPDAPGDERDPEDSVPEPTG